MGPLDKLKTDVEKLGANASTEAKSYVANHQTAANQSAQNLNDRHAKEWNERFGKS
jgi:F0F1-type ATP synthase membrane subunit b/b'